MKPSQQLLLVSLISCLLFGGCNSESDPQQEAGNTETIILGKMELSSGWARPGAKGQTSGIYLSISNGTASADTLLKVSSAAAGKAEIHESYTTESGTAGMHPAGEQIIKSGNELQLQPGGLHIMLMKLKHKLAVGDSVSASLEFAGAGTKRIRTPVKIQK